MKRSSSDSSSEDIIALYNGSEISNEEEPEPSKPDGDIFGDLLAGAGPSTSDSSNPMVHEDSTADLYDCVEEMRNLLLKTDVPSQLPDEELDLLTSIFDVTFTTNATVQGVQLPVRKWLEERDKTDEDPVVDVKAEVEGSEKPGEEKPGRRKLYFSYS